jgi:predicted AAA+ superfamily ATPase
MKQTMIEDLYELSQAFVRNFKKDYHRYFFYRHLLSSRFSIISGPRGIGKTTTLIQYFLKFTNGQIFSRDALYISADHFLLAQCSLYEIADQFSKEGGKYLFIDEIHKYSDWTRELKSINDSYPNLKIIGSGSSALHLHLGNYDLSRRAIFLPMAVMSFREFIELSAKIQLSQVTLSDIITHHQLISEKIVKTVEAANQKILPLFRQYLEFGCYPYFQEYQDKTLFYSTLAQGISATIESDLPAVYPGLTGSGIKRIKQLLAFIAESAPFTPDLSKIKRILDIGDERTLKLYLKYLEDGGVILTISKKGRSLQSLEKPEKIYLHNPNLMVAIANRENLQMGNLRETFFASIVSSVAPLAAAERGDFLVDGRYTFEIGGRNKDFKQIKGIENSFLVLDDTEIGTKNRIPLWLFGFLY